MNNYLVFDLSKCVEYFWDVSNRSWTLQKWNDLCIFNHCNVEASYLDYQLFEELDALFRLSPAILDRYPTLAAYRERIQQGLQLTVSVGRVRYLSTVATVELGLIMRERIQLTVGGMR